MSPDTLAATRILLIKKCELDFAELNEKNIDLRSNTIWLRSFITNLCPQVEKPQEKWRANYLKYAFNGLSTQDLLNQLNGLNMDLKAWNIFIHNMLLAAPSYVDNTISSILKSFSASQYENLFFQSDLQNISIFLSRFNPRDGIFQWTFPVAITFQQLDFINKVQQSSIEVIAYFLFTFYYIGRPDLCHYFAESLETFPQQLLPKIESADINSIEFFLWNLWMALPEGKKISLLNDNSFIEMLLVKTSEAQKEKERILGLIGTLYLSCAKVPKKLIVLVKTDYANQLCSDACKACRIALIRLLGGLMAISQNIPSDKKNIYLNALGKMTFDLKIPNQLYAVNQLKKSLME